jgi:hypothetical protein
VENRDQKFQNGLHRPDDEKEHADQRDEGQYPISGSAGEQERWEKLHGDDNFGAQKENHLDGRFPSAGDEKEHAASGDCRYQNEPEARQQAEGERSPPAIHVETGLDVRFERLEVIVNAPGVHAAKFAESTVEIGKYDETGRQSQYADAVEKNGHG